MIIKQPVPYVFLTIPDSMHLCPNRADCWSPAIPAIGTFVPKVSELVSPYTSLEDFTSGSKLFGIERSSSSSSSHFRSEEHTSELQSRGHLVCRLLLEKKNIL